MKMNVCPLCNGLKELHFFCSCCPGKLEDQGKVTDYFENYSPYMEIDIMKRFDGYPTTFSKHECVHLFYCPYCQNEEVRFIKESPQP